jgi:hypothetical protein
MRRVLILNLFLLAIVAVLAVQIVRLWWGGEPVVEAVTPKEAKAQKLDLPKVDRRPPPANLATQIADKDLFDQSRTGVPPGTVQAAATPAEPVRPLTLVLLGVSGGGPEREALVKDQTQPKPQWLRQGEEVGGYKLGRIDPTAIVMVGPGGEEVTLVINVEKAKAGQPGQPPVALGPAGIQPTPTPGGAQTRTPRGVISPGAARTPAPDIKEKIERLRQEARKRRGQAAEAAPQ